MALRHSTRLISAGNYTTKHLTALSTTACREGKDQPRPFLNSKAHTYKVQDAYVLTEKEQRRGRFAFPLGFIVFGVFIYFGFLREYGEKDKAKIDFLFKDISDKIPPHKQDLINKQLEQNNIKQGKQT